MASMNAEEGMMISDPGELVKGLYNAIALISIINALLSQQVILK